ncbi:MAG TPA: phospho-sugar mutase [Paenibacillus sp.]|uniref:phospho-sugar mutase n=1 Tax=Paenibacillus sp. TaxID=58172 RepID=UPI002CAA2202|nr:phospho-sugar mutase [Paenibacillus sp.]HUC92568.1 phospho-sugar mutase [Paenibacillus sp.]
MAMEPAVMKRYQAWMEDALIDEATKKELAGIAGDEKEIADRFYKELEFGTGGLRGVMGAGTNRMNAFTVGKATQGLADWLLGRKDKPSVVIAHDSRNHSPEFSLVAASVLAANGITAYLWRSLRPTPQLSYAVRALGADGGIVVTASHNPPEYNGYKVYGADGGQLVPADAEQVIASIQRVASFADVRRMPQEEAEAKGLIRWLGDKEDQAYVDAVAAESLNPELLKGGAGDALTVVYTPLHGAGNMPVRNVLAQAGFGNVIAVPEQERPDGYFPTVKSPNPEERDAFALALELARKHDADIVIGTDPDCDRMGAVVKNREGEYVVLSGNQSGALMVHYLLSQRKERGTLPSDGVVVKTIVTSEMGADIAVHYGAEVVNTLTGFKYIGEKMTEYERTGSPTFLFGYEESYGYLAGTYARDKDAVIASMLICEAAAYYKSKGKTLYEVLLELYEQFGTYLEHLESRTLKGIDGVRQIGAIMEDWRGNPPADVAGVKVERMLDYSRGLDGLPSENVLKFILADGSWFCLRPSGTEPKIKVYFAVRGDSREEADEAIAKLTREVMARVDNRS